MKAIRISEAEWEVMNVLWERAPIPSSEVVEALQKRKGWHSRTTRTLLDRLVKKQAVGLKANEKPLLYEAKISMQEAVQHESRSFLQRVFGGEPVSMLMHLVGETELSQEDIRKLKQILKKKEK